MSSGVPRARRARPWLATQRDVSFQSCMVRMARWVLALSARFFLEYYVALYEVVVEFP